MGCVSSKQTVSVTPALDISRDGGGFSLRDGLANLGQVTDEKVSKKKSSMSEVGDSRRVSSSARSYDQSLSFRLGNLQKYVEGEQVAAGWPAWLSAVAGEAIHGWVPLKLDAYKKLDKIGQGTYSSVFRAREIETGNLVALKKVRFDSFEPESVRFMAREIMILRRLNHPNIIKLEGIICSHLSSGIYLVFEYMEHDITGLLSCPDIKFSEPQIKCYMKQLLSGLSHCHALGIMHRDIKGSNLLVNNKGVLKVADFGLANFCSSGHRQPLTSRVVTLWYRPPELLLGSTDYGASVDLWSVGCVFAELIQGKPILQGRTEVEQLHKIFKLCGSPPDEYWKKSKLPHATLFKPQQPYDSCLRETFNHLQETTVNLIDTLLSVEPYKRGTASSAIASEYFTTEPFACDPSSLPVYPPSKEIDSKNLEDAKRKKNVGRVRGPEPLRRTTRKPPGINKLAPAEELATHIQGPQKANSIKMCALKQDYAIGRDVQNLALDKAEEALHAKNASQGDIPFSGPLQVSTSSGFAWAKRRKDEVSVRSHHRSISRGHVFNELDPAAACRSRNNDWTHRDSGDVMNGFSTDSSSRDLLDVSKQSMQKRWGQMERPDSFDACDGYYSQELSVALYQRGELPSRRNNLEYQDEAEKVEFSGPLLTQSHKVDEFLERHERHIRQVVRKSWFQKSKIIIFFYVLPAISLCYHERYVYVAPLSSFGQLNR